MSDSQTSLKRTNAGTIAAQSTSLLVGDLERALLHELPAKDACSWDRTGMLVGNPVDEIKGVAIALDPTIPALKAAHQAGANVLVTHHPVFLDAPDNFVSEAFQGHTPGAVVRFACEEGVSIMSFHTALDVSVDGLSALPSLLRLEPCGVVEPLEPGSDTGFGQICVPAPDDDAPGDEGNGGSISLRHLSARCVSVLGSIPRVWGAPDKEIKRIATCGGSAGSLLDECLEQGIDCLICGEVKYHDALNASLSGLSLIELGHDVSELPLCTVLAAYCENAGIDQSCITMIDQKNNWYTPESSRR